MSMTILDKYTIDIIKIMFLMMMITQIRIILTNIQQYIIYEKN